MSVEIFIVTYCKDIEWLGWCLKSIEKFATGFSGVTVAVPWRDCDALVPLCKHHGASVKYFDEVKGKGMLHHMAINCMADQFVDSDFVLHMDSDCIFVEPVTPDEYFHNGKPILLKESYERLKAVSPGVYYWKECTERALNRPVFFETMRRHPAVHPMKTYQLTRDAIQFAQKRPFLKWAVDGQNHFPQFWSEFNLIGAVALDHCPEVYHWIDIGVEPAPKDKMQAFWSHGGLDRINDRPPLIGETPRAIFERLLK